MNGVSFWQQADTSPATPNASTARPKPIELLRQVSIRNCGDDRVLVDRNSREGYILIQESVEQYEGKLTPYRLDRSPFVVGRRQKHISGCIKRGRNAPGFLWRSSTTSESERRAYIAEIPADSTVPSAIRPAKREICSRIGARLIGIGTAALRPRQSRTDVKQRCPSRHRDSPLSFTSRRREADRTRDFRQGRAPPGCPRTPDGSLSRAEAASSGNATSSIPAVPRRRLVDRSPSPEDGTGRWAHPRPASRSRSRCRSRQ